MTSLLGGGSPRTGSMSSSMRISSGGQDITGASAPFTAPLNQQNMFAPDPMFQFGNGYQNDFLLPWLMFT